MDVLGSLLSCDKINMKCLTFALAGSIIAISSVGSWSLSAHAESREEYCRHHDCGEHERDRDHAQDHDRLFERYHDRYGDRHLCESHHRSCWYDGQTKAWRFRD